MALELLAERAGKVAIPTLREALDEPRLWNRLLAAHLLGTLGDKSGLERMRQDYRELLPGSGESARSDPNVTDPNAAEQREKERRLHGSRLLLALDVVKVLAELGDRRGYELAVRHALEGGKLERGPAVDAMVAMAKADKATLQSEGLDPVSVLTSIANSKTDSYILGLFAKILVDELPADTAIEILEVTKNSPGRSKHSCGVAQKYIDMAKAKKKSRKNN